MPDSLENIIQADKYALQTIPLAVLSPIGQSIVWIIVEDEYDKLVYQKFFTANNHIFTSIKSTTDSSRGYKNVEEIVDHISTTTNAYIFGIRDADYTSFNPSYIPKDNVFLTDARDIEMMMFECDDVKKEFCDKYNDYTNIYKLSISISKEIGFYRAFNDVNEVGFSFKKKLKFDFLRDINNRDDLKVVIDYLSELFSQNVVGYSTDDFSTFKHSNSSKQSFILCQGHDVIRILATLLPQQIKKESLENDLVTYYSSSCFSSSALFRDIESWCSKQDKIIWQQ
ncbi:MAG: hypothetical protein KBA86_07655 [Bacteroidales bacterium]|nr:hypothetical protein [Bacteroidales bacterium]